MVTLVFAANIVVDQFERGVLRNAVDEGARAGATTPPSVDLCQSKAQEVLLNLSGGPIGHGATVTCTMNGNAMVATGTMTLTGWLPGIPTWHLRVQGQSTISPLP